MNSHTSSGSTESTRRRRGICLTAKGLKKIRDTIDFLEEQENFGERYTLHDLSDRIKLDPVTIGRVLDGTRGVDKRTLERCFRAMQLELDCDDYTHPGSQPEKHQSNQKRQAESAVYPPQQDLRERPPLSPFCGRTQELAQLTHWLRNGGDRLITLVGMGGIGKTALAVQLVEYLNVSFDYVIWKSLRHAPPLQELLASLLQELPTPSRQSSSGSAHLLQQLNQQLSQHRCLLVFDQFDAILQVNQLAGHYREGYEDYSILLHQIAEVQHQSCLIVTSREEPREVRHLAETRASVQNLALSGLCASTGRELLQTRGIALAGEADSQLIVEHYSGNPLALHTIASIAQDYFNSNMADLIGHLQQGDFRFHELCNVLPQQIDRLTAAERQIIDWLAAYGDWITMQQLQTDAMLSTSLWKLLEAIDSLRRRHLIEKRGNQFIVQSDVMNYVADHLTVSTAYGRSSTAKQRRAAIQAVQDHRRENRDSMIA